MTRTRDPGIQFVIYTVNIWTNFKHSRYTERERERAHIACSFTCIVCVYLLNRRFSFRIFEMWKLCTQRHKNKRWKPTFRKDGRGVNEDVYLIKFQIKYTPNATNRQHNELNWSAEPHLIMVWVNKPHHFKWMVNF